jgi:hypothetical protein
LLNRRPHFLKIITNFYLQKVSFCNGFFHNLHKSQFFFFYHKNYFNKQELHWMFLPWLALKDWPFDYHESGMFRTDLGVVACSSHNTVTTTTPSIIQMSMHWISLRWRSRMVMIWCFDNKSPISIKKKICHSIEILNRQFIINSIISLFTNKFDWI